MSAPPRRRSPRSETPSRVGTGLPLSGYALPPIRSFLSDGMNLIHRIAMTGPPDRGTQLDDAQARSPLRAAGLRGGGARRITCFDAAWLLWPLTPVPASCAVQARAA